MSWMGMGNWLRRGAGGWHPENPREPPCVAGTAAVSPAEVMMQLTQTRESSGLYTVSSTLYAPVTREDRHSRYHCTVHYWLRGQRHTLQSQEVKINIFCESGVGRAALVPCSGAGH